MLFCFSKPAPSATRPSLHRADSEARPLPALKQILADSQPRIARIAQISLPQKGAKITKIFGRKRPEPRRNTNSSVGTRHSPANIEAG
jgi:hypothetical protein